jgi:Bacterial pre-peptidase C-terminal domain
MTDNSLAKAQSLGALDNNSVVKRDALNRRDRVDYFKFSLGKSGSANFKLSGLRSNAALALLDGTGKVIARSNKGGNKPEKLQRQLGAGTYYLQVKGGVTPYKLKSSAVVGGGGGPIPPGAGAGTANNPIDLGTLNSTPVSRSQDSAGLRNETNVYYKFQMGQIGEVNFRMSQVTGSGRLSLYYDTNRNGAWDSSDQTLNFGVATGSPSNNTTETQVLPAAGTYFVVGGSDNLESNVRYDMLLTPTLFPGNLPSDPGPEETTAYNLGTLNKGSTIEIRDYVGEVDQKDVYKFNLSSAAKLTYNKLETTANKFSVYSRLVYDKNNNGLKDSTDQEFFIENISEAADNLQAGNYLLFVDRGDAAYTINLSAS